MKKIISLLLVVLLAVSMSCAAFAQAQFTETYRIAWIMPDMFNSFWTYMRQGAEKAAAEYAQKGVKVQIDLLAPINTFNVEEQVAIFENAIEMGVDAIGICVVDQNAVIEQVNKAWSAGIPTCALSTDIPNSDRYSYAGHDDSAWAQKVAEYIIDQNGGSGDYVILEGLSGNLVSDLRTAGYKAAIEAKGCTLLEIQPANFSESEGLSLMENLIVKYGAGELQGVFTVNDNVALGAMEAIQAADRTEILIGSVDGNEDAALAIAEGGIAATFASNPWDEGYAAVYSLVEYCRGNINDDPQLAVEPWVVTKENVDEYLSIFGEWSVYYKA